LGALLLLLLLLLLMMCQDQREGVSSVCQLIGDDLVSRISDLISSEKYTAHAERGASSDGDVTRSGKDSSADGDAATSANEGDAAHERRDSVPDFGISSGEGDAGKDSREGDAAYEMGVALCAWESLASVCNVQVTMRYISQVFNPGIKIQNPQTTLSFGARPWTQDPRYWPRNLDSRP
jgi:hypothetical protein